jgi:glycosyltransferase involved in cell wall biosynthesis
VRRNCRGTGAEAAAYGAALALWQQRLVAHADAVVVPSAFAERRLRELGAPLGRVHVVGHAVREVAARSTAAEGTYALVASRLAVEKGVDVAVDACARAGLELVVAGDGPQAAALRARAAGTRTRFEGTVDAARLARLRAGAALALVPSRSAETFGLAAAEAMAAGLPVAGSAVGALPELVGPDGLVAPGDPAALAAVAAARFGDERAGEEALRRVREHAAPAAVARALAAVYAGG